MPSVAEVLNAAAGNQRFLKLDFSDAYLQVELDEDSRKYGVLTIYKILFRVNRLAFGLSAAPAIFQSINKQILQNVLSTQPYIDDVMITGATTELLVKNLQNCSNECEQSESDINAKSVDFLKTQSSTSGM